METIKNIKKWLLQGLGILIILWMWGISYATWTSLSTETTWETLTAEKWNNVINRLNSIDEEQLPTAWVKFGGGWGCVLWTWTNECVINSSYNISSVTKISTWVYNINFINPIDKKIASISINADGWWTTWWIWFVSVDAVLNNSYQNDLDNTKLWINIRSLENNVLQDRWHISVTVFGGQ